VNHPWTTLHKWLLEKVDLTTGPIVEIGCGSGRLSGELAQHKPEQAVYGFDYSYQLLRAATDYWLESQQLKWQFPRGYAQAFLVPARAPLENLHFGLARAEQLPLPDDSVGVLVGSFLLDRLADPLLALAEWYRVLRSGGYLLLASPLNFQSKAHWESFHPFEKWLDCCREAGWKVKAHPPKISLQEPLDQQGNAVLWQCERLLLQKP
jgi:ubiquinone/menaquinone biosynthesis C-methylase UbiE